MVKGAEFMVSWEKQRTVYKEKGAFSIKAIRDKRPPYQFLLILPYPFNLYTGIAKEICPFYLGKLFKYPIPFVKSSGEGIPKS